MAVYGSSPASRASRSNDGSVSGVWRARTMPEPYGTRVSSGFRATAEMAVARLRVRSAGGRLDQAAAEELEHLVEGLARRVPGLVHQVVGQHRVGVLADPPGVALRGVDLDADEAVAQLPPQRLEPGVGDGAILGEPQPEHAGAVGDALLHHRQVGGRELD